jgi:hypothetical protein
MASTNSFVTRLGETYTSTVKNTIIAMTSFSAFVMVFTAFMSISGFGLTLGGMLAAPVLSLAAFLMLVQYTLMQAGRVYDAMPSTMQVVTGAQKATTNAVSAASDAVVKKWRENLSNSNKPWIIGSVLIGLFILMIIFLVTFMR